MFSVFFNTIFIKIYFYLQIRLIGVDAVGSEGFLTF